MVYFCVYLREVNILLDDVAQYLDMLIGRIASCGASLGDFTRSK